MARRKKSRPVSRIKKRKKSVKVDRRRLKKMKGARRRERKRIPPKTRKGRAKKTRPSKIRRVSKRALPKRRRLPRRAGAKFRDSNGKFITRKQWERKNLPRKRLRIRRRKPLRPGVVEGERYFTPRLKYEYRQFFLPDYDADTIAGVISDVKGEPRPWPILFLIVLSYTTEDGGSGEMGTAFFDFDESKAGQASAACDFLESKGSKSDDVEQLSNITMLCTYSVLAKRYRGRRRKRK